MSFGWQRFRHNRAAMLCSAIVVAVALAAIVGPFIGGLFGVDATTPDLRGSALPPSWHHPMGTDVLGRDLLVRTLAGGRVALRVGILAAAIAVVVGVTWGGIAGFVGGKTDALLMRIVDVLTSLPQIIFVIVVMALTASRSELLLDVLIGGVSWLTMARVVRGQVMVLRRSDHVIAARSIGASGARLLVRHILPNASGIIVVYASLLVPSTMLQEAFLSYLGFGIPAPGASWGTLVMEGVSQLVAYPWLLVGPGAVMGVTLLALNFVGDGLRDAFDPRS
jgi:oligopeptide transport system permease protein